MKRFAELALAVLVLPLIAGCQAHSTATASRPAIDSLGEMTAAPTANAPAALQPGSFDYRALLGNPPADGSPEHRAEVELMLKLQELRTPADERRCQEEEAVTAFGFSNVLGPWFNPDDLPYTAKLMREIGQQAKAVSGGGKKIWSRVRPPFADARIHPCVALEKTFSYPSGHATIGAFWGAVLADMFPADHDMLIARGRQIGFDRTVAGMHWPTDVVAGQKLGDEVARRLLADPAFRKKLDKAKAECADAMKRQPTTQPRATGGPSRPSPRPADLAALQFQPAGR